MRQLEWMAHQRNEWFDAITRIVAAAVGVDISGSRSDVMPYNPAILQALAESGKEMR